MKDVDIVKDLLHYRITNQLYYNEKIIEVRNPEVRQVLTQLRDDEMRAVVELQQKVERFEASPGIISKLFPTKPNY